MVDLIKGKGNKVQVFSPKKGDTLVSPYTPTSDQVVMLGGDVDITLDGISMSYTVGNIIGFRKGVTYTLSASIPVHKM